MYEGSTTFIKTKEKIIAAFVTQKEITTGCVLKPVLFNMYIADLDRFLEKRYRWIKSR